MAMRLIDSLTTTPKMAEVFSDESVLSAMLAFEAALARAEAGLGIIPASAAAAIEKAARVELYDACEIAAKSSRSGTVTIPLVKALTDRVRAGDEEAAGFVHWGATSQDVADTAIVLLLKQAREILQADFGRLESALDRLAEKHAQTVMLGRTLLQAALPTTFGLKAAGWLGAVRRSWARLDAAFEEALVLQFGGAAGTLASLGENGIAVGQGLSRELSMSYPDAPWHTQRDRLAALMCALGVVTGSLGKMARDISLLAQNEVGEAAEPVAEGRGGSSAMPQKQNPVGCTLALAAAYRVPGLVSTFLSGMVQEHERAAGGWQAEWSTISSIVQSTGAAASAMVEVSEGLMVDAARMSANVEATRGTIFAERATLLLSKKIGREKAGSLVRQALDESLAKGRDFVDAFGEMREVNDVLDAATLRDLRLPESYLGVAEEFRRGLIDSPMTKNSGASGQEGHKS